MLREAALARDPVSYIIAMITYTCTTFNNGYVMIAG